MLYIFWFFLKKKQILIGSLLTYVVRIFFWQFTKLWGFFFFLITTWILEVEIKNKDLHNV